MRGYVDTDWGQLHYRASGAAGGAPVVVLLHESPRSSLVYEPIMPALGAAVSAFAFDTPGFGQSDSATAGAPFDDYARILLQAIDALGIGAFTPVGMKTGSSLAITLATLANEATPGRVTRAVLYAAEPPDQAKAEQYALAWAPPLDIPADGSLFTKLWAKNVGIYGTGSPRDLALAVAETVVNIDRYNSIYPVVFRATTVNWERMLALRDAGVALTFIHPSTAQMTADDTIEFVEVEGTAMVRMPVTGQFAARAPDAFVAAILAAAT
ncbi:MAG: hypothetical protein JWR01_2865 [Subtercola sp.]|nr:hypothetical protein [Subtercola sp.]